MGRASTFFDLNSEVSLSAGHDRMVVFARRESGELAHISEVDNGQACGCYCLACHEALIARQGAVREHSFAHRCGTQCQHAMEAMLHGVIQQLIQRHRQFVTPELIVSASVPGPHGALTDARRQPAVQVPVDSVAVVERPPWRRGCVEVWVKGRSVLLHVAVRRRSRSGQRQALADQRQAAIECDLSGPGVRTVGDLARLLMTTDGRKTWLFNPKALAIEAEIQAALQPVADQQWAAHHAAQQRQRAREQQRAQALAQERAQWQQRLALQAAQRHSACQHGVQHPTPPEPDALPTTAAAAPPAASAFQAARPADLSPAVEYSSPAGRLWMLHSSDGMIHLRVEADFQQALDAIGQCGAQPHAEAGIWRISPEGWSSVSVALLGIWTAVRTVSADR